MGNSSSSEGQSSSLNNSELDRDRSTINFEANAPIKTIEVLNLTSMGINNQSITPKDIRMESEKYICVIEISPQNSLVIIDMSLPIQKPLRITSTADSALMNPNKPILAFKVQNLGTTEDHLHIFDIQTKTKIKFHQMSEQVVFWKWITPEMLAIVTNTTVYHWSFEGESEPIKMFDRTSNLKDNEIISYKCDSTKKWFILIGTTKGNLEGTKLVKGNMQIFSVDKRRSQPLEGHAASFASYKVGGKVNPSILLCVATKNLITSKLHVLDLSAEPGRHEFKKETELVFPGNHRDDFPLSMQVSQKYGLIYVITKMGLLFVYDLETAKFVYSDRFSSDPIFLTTEATTSGGFYAINEKGKVLLANVNDATIVPFVSGQLNNRKLAMTLSRRVNIPIAENLVVERFEELFLEAKYEKAVELAAEYPQGILRSPEIYAKLQSVVVQDGGQSRHPLFIYFGILITQVKLNAFESVELCRLVLEQDIQNRKNLLEHWFADDKLECTKQLGDLVKTVDRDLALKIYNIANLSAVNNLNEVPHIKRSISKVGESSSRGVNNITEFSLSELEKATNNFDTSNKIGEGGSGIVYKGILRCTTVAVKKLNSKSTKGDDREFYQEAEILTTVRHPNLVTLIGVSTEARTLIYEFVPNGSLETFLNNRNNNAPRKLSWQNRIRIASEICSALIFLHSIHPHGIAHGDLKPENVLLDSNFTSKLSDFGISRTLHRSNKTLTPVHVTGQPKGTWAYMDPEYFSSHELTSQSDTFSFGIILLQFVTGRDPFGIRNFVENSMKSGNLDSEVDRFAGNWPMKEAKELASLGLWCSKSARKERPDLATEVWPLIESLKNTAGSTSNN